MRSVSISLVRVLALSALALAGCNKDDVVTPDPNPIPSADPANNVCVITQNLDAKTSGDELSDACGYDKYSLSDSTVIAAMNNLANTLERGTSGTKYKVLNKGWKKTGSTVCNDGWTFTKTAEAWVSYDCRGVAVDVKIYGPYPASTLTVKTNEIKADLEQQGYTIAYISQDRVDQNGSIYYLSFFVYKEDAANARQAAVVASLKDARTFNRLTTFGANRPLADTLVRASKFDASLEKRQDFQSAKALVEALDEIRASSEKLRIQKARR